MHTTLFDGEGPTSTTGTSPLSSMTTTRRTYLTNHDLYLDYMWTCALFAANSYSMIKNHDDMHRKQRRISGPCDPHHSPVMHSPGSPKTIKNRFSPKTIFWVGNLSHPKLGTMIFIVWDFQGTKWVSPAWASNATSARHWCHRKAPSMQKLHCLR